MRYNKRNKSQFLKNKGNSKIQEIDIRKNLKKLITHKKILNVSTKNKENCPEKVKRTIEKNTIIRNSMNYSSPLKTSQSNIIKSGINNLQIRNNININKSLLLKNKGNKKNQEKNQGNINIITCKKIMNISPKKYKDLSKTLKKTVINNGASFKREKKLLDNNTEGTKSLLLKKKGNNKKQKNCGRKDKGIINRKKSINFNPKRKKDLVKKLNKTVNNKSATLRREKTQVKNKMNETKPLYLKKKGNKKKIIDGKTKLSTVTHKKDTNFCPKDNTILNKKLKKTVNNKGASLKKKRKQMKNNINGTKRLYMKKKRNNEKQENCSLKKKENKKKLEKYGKKSINSVTSKNKKDLSKKLKKTQINNCASLKTEKQKKRNNINGTKTLSLKKKANNNKTSNDGMKKINSTALKNIMNISPKNNEDLSEKVRRIIGNNTVITKIEKDVKVQLVRLSESLITRYCLTALKNNTTITLSSNHNLKRAIPSRNKTKKNCCSLCCKKSIIKGISKKIEKNTLDSNNLITNQINNLSSLRSKVSFNSFIIEKNVRVQLVRLSESLITKNCLSVIKKNKIKGLSVNHANIKAKISKNMTKKKKYCSLRLKKSIIKKKKYIKQNKTMNDNAVITNQIDNFSSLTSKDIGSKFEMKKEARVQLVRLRESCIINDSLSQVKNSTSQCVSLNSIRKKDEISKNRTNIGKNFKQDPKESIIKDILDKNEICDISKEEPLFNMFKVDDTEISVLAPVITNSVMVSDTKIVHSKVQNDLTNSHHSFSVACKRQLMDKIPIVVMKRLKMDRDKESKEIKGQSNKNNPLLIALKSKEQKIDQNEGKYSNSHKEVRVVVRRLKEDFIKRYQGLLSNLSSDSSNCLSDIDYASKVFKKITFIKSRNKISDQKQVSLQKRSSKNSKLHVNYAKQTSMIKSVFRYNTDHPNISNSLKNKFEKKSQKSCISMKKNSARNGNCLNSAFKVFCTSQLSYNIRKGNKLCTM